MNPAKRPRLDQESDQDAQSNDGTSSKMEAIGNLRDEVELLQMQKDLVEIRQRVQYHLMDCAALRAELAKSIDPAEVVEYVDAMANVFGNVVQTPDSDADDNGLDGDPDEAEAELTTTVLGLNEQDIDVDSDIQILDSLPPPQWN